MLTVEAARMAVRLTNDKFDEELQNLIDAAVLDLSRVGIELQRNDELYDQALRMYVKGNFEPGAPEAEACRRIYSDLKMDLKLSEDYREEDDDDA